MSQRDEKEDARQMSIRVPVPLYEIVARAAQEERRSVNGQIVYLVEKGLQGRQEAA
jgi:hypothetical protein